MPMITMVSLWRFLGVALLLQITLSDRRRLHQLRERNVPTGEIARQLGRRLDGKPSIDLRVESPVHRML